MNNTMDTKHMSKAEAEAEKKRWADKYFDYAESAIKEWIAEIFGSEVIDMFDDYNGDSDVLNVKADNGNHTFYLTPFPTNTPAFNISRESLLSDPVLKRASSMMYEAVYTVYVPIIKTMSSMNHLVEDAFPHFDEKTMSFRLVAMNAPYRKRMELEKKYEEIEKNFDRLNAVPESEMNADTVAGLKQKLDSIRTETVMAINEITQEICEKAQEECNTRNAMFADATKLYVCCELNKEDIDVAIKLKRMPDFGLKYQDPDEENYVDRLKKEFEVND